MAKGKRQRQRDRRALGHIQESAATVTEVRSGLVDLIEAGVRPDGTIPIKVISPGWGSAGYYSPEVLEAASTARAFPAGTQMYLDHPTVSERGERPERSLRDLAAVLETDATWHDDHPQGPGLYAEARVFSQYRDLVAEMADHIGVSIRAAAELAQGEAEGRRGPIVEKIVEGLSVDFVTKAGRGGKVLAVYEAHRPALEAGLYSDDLRNRLRSALVDRFGEGDGRWCYVRDFNDTDVVFELYGDEVENPGTFRLPYQMQDDQAVLDDGTPTEVKVTTTYTPVTPPTTTEESMDTKTEERLAALEEKFDAKVAEVTEAADAKITEAETRTTEAVERAERAEAALLVEAAGRHVAANDKVRGLPAVVRDRVVRNLAAEAKPGDDGKLDTAGLDEAIATAVKAEVDYLTEAVGSPVTGAGGGPTGTTEQLDEALAGVFENLGLSEDAAKSAVAEIGA